MEERHFRRQRPISGPIKKGQERLRGNPKIENDTETHGLSVSSSSP